MYINVSTLLREPVGATRAYEVTEEPVSVADEAYASRVSGAVRLLRITRGILVHAALTVHPTLECSRCLRSFNATLHLVLDEIFVPDYDALTGEPTAELTPDEFRVVEQQYIDLSEAVRQYEQLERPLGPLCRDNCAGLCAECGHDLNEGACDCPAEAPHGRWAGLAVLADRLRTMEESDGGSKA